MENNKPQYRTAILIPVHNDGQRLTRTLEPLVGALEPRNFTVVLVDDGSEPALSLDPNWDFDVHIIRNKTNRGITHALNLGLEWINQNSFDYVARLDAGDISPAERFVTQSLYLEEHPNIALVACLAHAVDDKGRYLFNSSTPTTEQALKRAMRYNNVIPHPTVMFRITAVREVGFYSEDYPAAEDYEYFMRFVSRYTIGVINQDLLTYHIHWSGISLSKKRLQIRSRLKVQIRYFNFREIHSYMGMMRSMIALLIPARLGVWRRTIMPKLRSKIPSP